MNDELQDALKFDPFLVAEEFTESSYKEDAETEELGMYLHIENRDYKRGLLEKAKDLSHSVRFDYFEAVMKDMGFEVVLEEHFGNSETDEILQIWWEDTRGILAFATSHTYGSPKRNLNSAKFFGNLTCFENMHTYTSSGHMTPSTLEVGERQDKAGEVVSARYSLARFNSNLFKTITNEQIAEKLGITPDEVQSRIDGNPEIEEYVWSGDWHHEGIRHSITNIDERTTWIREWAAQPFFWFLTHCDTKDENYNEIDYDYEEITQRRFSQLPERVKKCISPEGSMYK